MSIFNVDDFDLPFKKFLKKLLIEGIILFVTGLVFILIMIGIFYLKNIMTLGA